MLKNGRRYLVIFVFVCACVLKKTLHSIYLYKGNYPKIIVDVVRVGNFSNEEFKKNRTPRNVWMPASILVRYEK